MSNQKKEISKQGFTLMELIIVIVIIAILLAFAIPRFVSIASNARISALATVQGSISSSQIMAHSQALTLGYASNSNLDIIIEGKTVSMKNGYPDGNGIITTLKDTTGFTVSSTQTSATFTRNDAAKDPASCKLVYTASTDTTGNTKGQTALTVDGC